jgi:SAM-dependent methyltransferase
VQEGELTAARLPSEHFDLVWMSHVLEHVHDPKTTLQEVRRILKPAGAAFLEIPIRDALLPVLFGSHYYGLECPRHLYHFSRKDLRELAASCGFTLRPLSRTSFPHVISLSISYWLESLFPRKKAFLRRHIGESSQKTSGVPFRLLAVLIHLLGFGEVVMVELRRTP